MHDPMTLVWRIRIPLPWFRDSKFRKDKDGQLVPREFRMRAEIRLVDIWHNDPQTDGSDDSCSVRRILSRKHGSLLKHFGSDEARSPWFLRERAKIPSSPADAEALLRGALWHVARCLGLNRWSLFHKRVTFEWCAREASELLHNTADNVRSSLCLLPGYHTNDQNPDGPPAEEIDLEDHAAWAREDRRSLDDPRYPKEASEYWRRERSEGFFFMVAKILSRETARWWQHPRWHFWHWSFQVHAWRWFMRRYVERCGKCRKRFKGRSVFSDWGGTRKWCAACEGVSEPSMGASVAKPYSSLNANDFEQANDPRA
jgi:hypothetical protein